MAVIRVEPSGVEVEVDEPTSIMAAATRAGYSWPTVCEGQGQCLTCYVRVLTEPAHLSPPAGLEREGLARLTAGRPGDDVLRLACQALVVGDVTVFKRGVRRR